MFGWDDAAAAVLKIVDKVIPDPQAKAQAAFQLAQMKQAGEFKEIEASLQTAQMQADINKVEAASGSLFTSGWRPCTGWICGLSLGYAAIIDPVARFVATVVYRYDGPFPVIDTAITLQLLFGLLGLGAMRSRDKEKGVAS